ncbi:MAG: 30S ribosomal protein S6 [Candidatus Paceibacterota bacterium]
MAENDTQALQENGSEIIAREYECAYLLMPTIAEEKVAGEVEAIRSVIEKNSAGIVQEKEPEKMPLAYEMTIKREGKKDRFLEAYFGWMTFTASSEAIAVMNEELARNSSLIRFMIILAAAEQGVDDVDESLVSPQSEEDQVKLDDDASSEDIDKSIDALVDEEETVTAS